MHSGRPPPPTTITPHTPAHTRTNLLKDVMDDASHTPPPLALSPSLATSPPLALRQQSPRVAAVSAPAIWPGLFTSEPTARWARLCVLGSGSRGNCSVLEVGLAAGSTTRVLIDLGLSPRVTREALHAAGISLEQIDGALLTHMDADHCHQGWSTGLPRHAEVFVHRRHIGRANHCGLNAGRLHAFDGALVTRHGVVVRPHLTLHDRLGCAVFRFELPGLGSVGYATDLGRVTTEVVDHLRGVDVLAIESNYCPDAQAASDRPDFLKRRITGGRGHLSNAESLQAIEAIAPRRHVVLLHLSRDCNDPQLVAALHEGSDYSLTIATQHTPTRWVRLGRTPDAAPTPGSPLALPIAMPVVVMAAAARTSAGMLGVS